MFEQFDSQFWDLLDQLIQKAHVVVDRPKDSPHPDYPDAIYPLDYGYLAGTTSSDGAGIDVWIGAGGEKKAVGVICTVDLIKQDSEVKVLLGCSDQEMRDAVKFVNTSDNTSGLLIRR